MEEELKFWLQEDFDDADDEDEFDFGADDEDEGNEFPEDEYDDVE